MNANMQMGTMGSTVGIPMPQPPQKNIGIPIKKGKVFPCSM